MRSPVELRYGRTSFRLAGDRLPLGEVLAPRLPPFPEPPERLIRQRLSRPSGSPPLREVLRGAASAAILVSDITRYSATEVFLSPVLAEADAAGIPRDRVTVVLARGTHRPMTDGEVEAVVGPEFSSGIRVIQSDPDGEMVRLGTTRRGTPVDVFRPVLQHDRIVLTGTISFHYFAGFGGGRKAMVPGCSSRETAAATHFRIFREDGPGKHPLARAGVLAGNPVHEDLVEAVGMAPPAFLLNTLLTPSRRVYDASAGHWMKAHEEGCARYAKTFRIPLPRRFPLVIASAGGHPKDINFIQAHKALDHAFQAVEPGGVLLLLAECPDGFGSPDFFPWFRFGNPDEMEAALRANYRIYGQTAHATLVKAKGCRVILASSLPPEEVRRMGMIPAASPEEGFRRAGELLGSLPPAVVLPDAGYVLPAVPG